MIKVSQTHDALVFDAITFDLANGRAQFKAQTVEGVIDACRRQTLSQRLKQAANVLEDKIETWPKAATEVRATVLAPILFAAWLERTELTEQLVTLLLEHGYTFRCASKNDRKSEAGEAKVSLRRAMQRRLAGEQIEEIEAAIVERLEPGKWTTVYDMTGKIGCTGDQAREASMRLWKADKIMRCKIGNGTAIALPGTDAPMPTVPNTARHEARLALLNHAKAACQRVIDRMTERMPMHRLGTEVMAEGGIHVTRWWAERAIKAALHDGLLERSRDGKNAMIGSPRKDL